MKCLLSQKSTNSLDFSTKILIKSCTIVFSLKSLLSAYGLLALGFIILVCPGPPRLQDSDLVADDTNHWHASGWSHVMASKPSNSHCHLKELRGTLSDFVSVFVY
jgi:hypothetical protein